MSKRLMLAAGVAAIIAAGLYFSRSYFLKALKDSALPSKSVAAAAPAPASAIPAAASVKPANQPPARELDRALNPYAAALREPGKAKRAWDADFLKNFANAASDQPIRFELCGGRMAAGTIKIVQQRNGETTYLSGELTEPEPGKFFFLTPPPGGKAGKAAGVIEFPASSTAYRIEPTGPNGEPELWQRRLDEVICLNLPPPRAAAATNIIAEMPPLRPDTVPSFVPSWNSNIISLQSYPGSSAVLLLDFFGGYTPTWGGVTYSRPNVNNTQIKDLWKRVAEDFMPFNINVTTDIKVYQAAPASSRQRCAFTETPITAAGVAYIGSWNWGSDTPCWSVYNSGKSGAEVGAHEPGHTLNLGHQTQDFPGGSHNEYFAGHGSAPTGWAPTMGAGYYQPVTSWAKGEYENAGNHEDELDIIVTRNNNVDYRPDDTGATLATSRYLEIYSGNTASAEGVIEQTGDTDAFQFTTTGGAVSLTANPVGDWACLAVMATLADASDTIIASNNAQNVISASIATNLPAGTYTFRVTGAGRNNPQSDGFTAYASLGYYSVTGTVAGARQPVRFSIAENSTNGAIVGTITANNPNADPLVYAIVSGNTSNTFTVDETGLLTVANNSLLNYETLALNTMFPVQFELFVNITNTADPGWTELRRRVMVAVTNVNEAPTLAGFTGSVLEHTQPGAALGQVTASDLDFYTTLLYSIAAGNSNNMFAINATNGTIIVLGDLVASNQPIFNLSVVVSDQTPPTPLTATSTVTITVISNATPFRPGAIAYANYDNISGMAVSALTSAPVWPRDPTAEQQVTLFEGPTDRADNYGAAMRGYLIPSASGNYTFWIASDDNSELWLSTSTNPASATLVASVPGDTGSRVWTKYANQQSGSISLVAGRGYYVEARMKEGTGGDNIAVAWQCTAAGISRDVIPGRFLAPFYMNYIPRAPSFTVNLHKDAITGARVGTVTHTDVNPNDTHVLTILSGNSDGIFSLDSSNGILRVTNAAALQATAQTKYTLVVQATDNGSPPLSGTATVTVNIIASNAITATSPQQEIWNNIGSGNNVSDLTGNARFPQQPDALRSLTAFDASQNIADNYGSRIRAYLRPTSSGSFTFFIASDDASQLRLSFNSDPANATQIASVSGSTGHNDWTAQASQKSAPVSLVGGQTYYIEALHKEGGGQDHLEAAWTGPGLPTTNIIDDAFLTPVDLNYPPTFNNSTAYVGYAATNGATVTTVTATDSSLDALAYKIVSGNTSNAFAIDPVTGRITVANKEELLRTGGMFSLGVQAQDSGYGGLYPLKSAIATVTVYILGTNWPPIITLTVPNNGALLAAPVNFSVLAADPNANLHHVEYFADGAKIGQTTTAPYNFTWTNAPLGPHSLFAAAEDTSALRATSAVAHFTVVTSTTNTLIAADDVWRYFDLTNDLGTVWRSNTFSDTAWSSGPAMLGFGDANGLWPTTTIGSNLQWTTYFRRTFEVPDASIINSLSARLMRDDGAVIYLNGQEVWRDNMSAGFIANSTPANATVSGAAESTWFATNLSPAALINGTNLLAVEIHQINLSSSDITFDFELKANTLLLLSNIPPQVLLTSPPWGALLSPFSTLTLAADAYDFDGAVAKVEFFNSGLKLGEAANTPFQCAVSNLPVGACSLTARATDNHGGAATSNPVWVQVLPTPPVALVSTGAVWKFLDDGSDQGTLWRTNDFDDSAWNSGPAQLGYGDGDEATVVGYGPDPTNKYITTWFRNAFVVPDPSSVVSLSSRLIRDDGVIAYLNGVEFFRNNIQVGTINYRTRALTECRDDGTNWFAAAIDPKLLVAGTNIIAVEIHQANLTNDDISFDFELTASTMLVPAALLTLAPSGNSFELSWPAAAGNFALHTSTSLTPPVAWTPATNQPVLIDGNWTLPLPSESTTNRYYRLQSP